MKVIILVAGMGTRFLPLTERVPKPIITVGGAPVLSHILDALDGVNFDELILVTGYRADQIETYMRDRHTGEMHFVPQGDLDGTGGAVYAARDHIDCPVLIIFGDTIFEADLTALNAPGAGNRIWTRWVEDFQRFGIVQKNDAGHMATIVEKPEQDVGRQANIGLYYIEDYEALHRGLDHVMAGQAINGEYFFTYALNHMVEAGHKIEVHDVQGWHDCGTLDAILDTNAHLLGRAGGALTPAPKDGVEIKHPVHIHPEAHLEDCAIGPNVTIGPGTRISGGQISDAIIDGACDIKDVRLNRSLVGDDQVLSNTTLEGSILANGKVRKAS